MLRKILIIVSLVLAGLTASIILFLTVLFLATGGDYSVPATTAADGSLPVLDIDGYPFHGEVFGNRENRVIIVLHGGPGGDYRYILPLKELSDDYCIVFYDQRGSGLSPRVPDEELTVDRYIQDLDGIIDRFSPDRQVILIGHSWGAMLGSIYIGRHPDKVEKAVLAEPGFLNGQFMDLFYERTGLDDMKLRGRVLRALIRAYGESLHVKGPDGQARKDYMMNRFMTTPMPENPLSGYYRDNDLRNASWSSWRFGSAASSRLPASGLDAEGNMLDMTKGVEKWPGTALFISGSENTIIGPDIQTQQIKLFPRARLVVIEGAGHTMFGEKPEESLKVIRSYLSE